MAHLGAHNGHLVTDSGHLATCAPFSCQTSCPDTVFADVSTVCGNACNGLYEWAYDPDNPCEWEPVSGACTEPWVRIVWSDDDWYAQVPYAFPDFCDYTKSGSKSDCPTGTYTLGSDVGCGDCMSELLVWT